MRSAVLKNKKITIENKQIPNLKDKKGAIIKVLICGLCGSDIVKINHSTPENEGKISLGHEIVGEIIDINVLALVQDEFALELEVFSLFVEVKDVSELNVPVI